MLLEDTNEFENIDQFLGYKEKDRSNPICLVTKVTKERLNDIRELLRLPISVGGYLVTAGGCENLKVLGYYEELEEAFERGRKTTGATEFTTI